MDLYAAKNEAILTASGQYAQELEKGFSARFTHVNVINTTGKSGNFTFTIEFKFHGVDVKAAINGAIIMQAPIGWGADNKLLRFVNQHTTIQGLENELTKHFSAYLTKTARRLQGKLEDGYEGLGLKKEQKIYMLQQDYIDRGFDATITRLSNGKLKMIIGHELLKRSICELTLD